MMFAVEVMIFVFCFVILATTAVANKDVSIESRIKRNVGTDVGTTSGHHIDKHYSVKQGEKYTFPHLVDLKNEKMKWYFEKKLVATKHFGETWIADKKNFSMTVKGDLIIRKMTLFFEGWYTLLVGNVSKTIYIALRADGVIAINVSRYREWIIDGFLHREWDVSCEMSTGNSSDYKMALCSKRPEDPDEKPYETLHAKIMMKPGGREFKISYETSANISRNMVYYVEITSLDTLVTKTFELKTNQTKENGVTPSFSTHPSPSMTATSKRPEYRDTNLLPDENTTKSTTTKRLPDENTTTPTTKIWPVIVGILGCIAVIIIAYACIRRHRRRRGSSQLKRNNSELELSNEV